MIFSSLITALLNIIAPSPSAIPVIPWQTASIFELPTEANPEIESIVNEYLQGLQQRGLNLSQQGVWIQTPWVDLASNQGMIPLPSASTTKLVTSLGALNTWEINHRFITNIYTKGAVTNGILQGDLIIENGGNPFFVWEDAIIIAHELQQQGIKSIDGNLIIVGNWQMNFTADVAKSAEFLRVAFNSSQWNWQVEKQYKTLEKSISRPTIKITGKTVFRDDLPAEISLFKAHQSAQLIEILKLMNVYSNNYIAQSLTDQMGGVEKMVEGALPLINVPSNEIQLINGSGLGEENRISPRAACQILLALERQLQANNLQFSDLLPTSAPQNIGTIEGRKIPHGISVKTGTLAVVSALVGVFDDPSGQKVYFSLMNYGNGLDDLRNRQDQLLINLDNYYHKMDK
ncbi:MAG: D-alanyl-D-alanine carboxypeptidase [Cyanobacterium sp. T60_A2020_053]|nr:D-alanyl-D-alanine carboxypeptidase [Cyanobacterium sp. T60_A2020_053]